MYNPIRLPRNKHYGSNYWEGISFKYDRIVSSYSNLEYDNWILIETDPEIIDYCEQPCKVNFVIGGKLKGTIFDMWLHHRLTGEEFIEVKYSNELKPGHKNYERNVEQIEVQKEWCAEQGVKHSIKTEQDIRKNRILLDNKKRILSFVKDTNIATLSFSEQFIKYLTDQPTSFFTIAQWLPELNVYQIHELIFWHIYHGNVKSNIETVTLGNNTEVWTCRDKS
ncbi:TnsA endonuclease N-terminal domain-containing protein [Paenibacillus eucommiae]|uniref:TnsA endonuclease N-terminal domain-containing protein n=1 Tax=Paenibacillus eucommiae TaxID=1355755 RepID=A0ABS4IUE1_9BACL|nr:TnsA endonuclease N-terminal domain-containing protein [Paenibacillus eucommiae]MBP1991189.1 hypothetical protein [Paenibacillus eucommiae]